MKNAGNRCSSDTQVNYNGKRNNQGIIDEEEKDNKGITLVALVVSIIVLLILSMVSINAIVGENGLINRTQESRVLTLLANFLFEIESQIQDINIDNVLNDTTMSSVQMCEKLSRNNTSFSSDLADFNFFNKKIKDEYTRLNDVRICYNGDIYVDNYKRGKITLTSDVDNFVSDDGNTKITVYNGTVEEYKIEDDLYYLHATSKDKFTYWVDEKGVVISMYPDTIVYAVRGVKKEYTAVNYVTLQKFYFLNRILTSPRKTDYFRNNYGLTSVAGESYDGSYVTIYITDKHLLYSLYMKSECGIEGWKLNVYDFIGYQVGFMRVLLSVDCDKLISYTTGEIAEDNSIICCDIPSTAIKTENNYSSTDSFDTFQMKLTDGDDNGIQYEYFLNELDTRYFSGISYTGIGINKQDLIKKFSEKGYENINKIYYTVASYGVVLEQEPYGKNGQNISWRMKTGAISEKEMNVKYDEVIRSFNL